MTRKLSLKGGMDRLVNLLAERINPHTLVFCAIYGLPDSGKTYLIERVAEHFAERRTFVATSGGWPSESFLRWIADDQEHWATTRQIYLLHCGAEKCTVAADDPTNMIPRIFGRPLDLSVGIYNPRFYPQLREDKVSGRYNLIIQNTASVRKQDI